MDLKIVFPFMVLRGLCRASEESVSVHSTTNMLIRAIDPEQNKLKGIRNPFKKAVLEHTGLSQALRVSLSKDLPRAFGHTDETFPDFIIDTLNTHAAKNPITASIMANSPTAIRLG